VDTGPPWPSARDVAGPGSGAGPQRAFSPWETYETGEGFGWSGSYGPVPGQEPAGDPETPPQDAAPAGAGPAVSGNGAAYVSYVGDGSHAAYGIVVPGPAAPHEGPEERELAEAPEPEFGQAPESPAPGYQEPEYPEAEFQEPRWQAESADSLTADLLLPGRHTAAPPAGWRRALYQVTGGLVRAPQSAADRRRRDLVMRARTPVAGGHHRVAVLSLKGGVGKTTTTVGLGSTLASLRGDRIIAVDANPDRGTLCDKVRLETAATVRDLLNEEDQIRRYADVRAYTTQAPSGLEVLASDRDPTVSVAFSAEDYEDVARILEHYYSVCVTDCGTGLLHSAMAGVLHLADQIVLVSSPSVDGARSASATLDWLAAHQYGELVRGAVVVLSAVRPKSKSTVDLDRLEHHFATRCRAVVRIPYDTYLEEGAEVDMARLHRATADAYLALAAEVGDGFAWARH
jgi:MinD-like ATPase involved in chromosome partitioning or flagellar assembly